MPCGWRTISAFAGEKVEGEVVLNVRGEQQFYYNVIAPIREGERIYGILGVNVDVTERGGAEEALKKARDELERQVSERTVELREANQKLITTLERITDGFVSLDQQWHYTYINQAAALHPQKPRGVAAGDRRGEVSRNSSPEVLQRGHAGDRREYGRPFRGVLSGTAEHLV